MSEGLLPNGLQETKASECRVAGAENLAVSIPVTKLAELPVDDVPLAVVKVPADTHGENFTVFALDVEDIRVAVVEEQTRLAARLCLDQGCDVFQRGEVVFRQFLPDVSVVGVRFEERGYIGTCRGRIHRLPGVDVEAIGEGVVDVEAGAGLVELGRYEGLRPCRNGRLGDGLEEPGFRELRVAGTTIDDGLNHIRHLSRIQGSLENPLHPIVLLAGESPDDFVGDRICHDVLHCP